MAKLTKAQAKNHAEACKLLDKVQLSFDEKRFVLENWREDARHINPVSGAFFTPPALARDFAIEVAGPRVIDLCAGIGSLAFGWRQYDWDSLNHITCVEINPDYVEVGKKILPEATWIQGDVFSLPADIGHFDCAIANPPFGATKASGKAPRFTRNIFEYRVIDIASDIADYGVFIVPQTSAPFEYSGKSYYQWNGHEKYRDFSTQTSIALGANCGIDTSVHRNDWRGVAPTVEIVTADFREARATRAFSNRVLSTLEDAESRVELSRAEGREREPERQPTSQLHLF